MKKLIVILLLSFGLESYSQSWNGVPISGSVAQLKINFANKGFVFEKKEMNCYIFNGKVGYDEYEVYAFVTPKSGIVTKFIIYRSKETNWTSLYEDYDKVKTILTNKYGQPQSFEYFKDPYYLGDGYEMSAVLIESCNYVSIWIEADANTNISVEISKYQQVKMVYENRNNIDKYKMEVDEINRNIY